MSQKIIKSCFYLLFFLTPLIFLRYNYELFEYNKMVLVYLLTIISTSAWIFKMLNRKIWIFERTPLDIPILLFLLSQILSTIFSIDIHTSIWGYYSRSNGGLLSIVSYILLYYCLVSNFAGQKDQLIKFLKTALLGGLLVSLWAIPEHFGASPSCALLTGVWSDSCWQQAVKDRVFATLGQPNWLAAYLAMLIFPIIYFLYQAKSRFQLLISISLLVIFYMAFTFTYSRGATLGLGAGLVVFILLLTKDPLKKLLIIIEAWFAAGSAKPYVPTFKWQKSPINFRPFLSALLIFLVINLFYGSALTRFKLISSATPATSISVPATNVTQLENGGTESSQIRLIVWKGALDIFKHYPIFGSGVETFAYSYYQFRPITHNLVSEWDFLYNKAHNEYLNYLATTGALGFISYLLLIGTFIAWTIRQILKKSPNSLLLISILAAYTSYLVQNIFQFSVVIIAVFFFLFPALLFAFDEKTEFWPFPKLQLPKLFATTHQLSTSFLKFLKPITLLIALFFSFTLIKYWVADTHFASGSAEIDASQTGKGYNNLVDAVFFNSHEPFYRSELGYAAAEATVSTQTSDATLSAQLKNEAIRQTQIALKDSPNNVSYYKTAVRTYFQLSSIDSSFNQITLDALDKAIALSPTDPKLLYNKALILGSLNRNPEGIEALKKAIILKPNYRDAYFALGVFYQQANQKNLAIKQFQIVLKLIPNDPEALAKLKELGQ